MEAQSYSQSYYPMVKDSMMDFVQVLITDPPYPSTEFTRVKKYRGDTLINGKTYIKVFEMSHHNSDSSYNVDPLTSAAQYIGAVRDSGKQVFGFSKNDSLERLLYDFNLSIGDTLTFYSGWDYVEGPYKIVLQSIDSVLFNYPSTHYRKRYNYGFSSVIEGIGGLDGFNILRTTSQTLVCVRDKNMDIYKVSGYADSCSCFKQLILSQDEINDLNKITIYPNPTQSTFSINFEKNTDNIYVSLFDVTGKEIIPKTSINKSQNTFNLEQENPGIYFVRIEMNEQSVTRRIVKL